MQGGKRKLGEACVHQQAKADFTFPMELSCCDHEETIRQTYMWRGLQSTCPETKNQCKEKSESFLAKEMTEICPQMQWLDFDLEIICIREMCFGDN